MTVSKISGPEACRRKFLRHFPKGFRDVTYLAWERDYKWETHQRWEEILNRKEFRRLLEKRDYAEIAARAVRTEQRSRHSMIFSFEKMALRDAVKSEAGARAFATALYDFLHGPGSDEARFATWCKTVAALPRKQTRVFTWPLVTVYGFIAQPDRHIFLKPTVTKLAANKYGFDFEHPIETDLGDLRQTARIRRDHPPRPPRFKTARSDRRAILHLGSGLRRIRLSVLVSPCSGGVSPPSFPLQPGHRYRLQDSLFASTEAKGILHR